MRHPFPHVAAPIIAVIIVTICIVTHIHATTFDWSNASGGTFSTAANWSPAGGPPTGNDTARFSLNNTYSVTLNSSTTVNTLTQTQGDVSLNLNNNTLLLTSNANNALGAAGLTSTLRLATGNFQPGNLNIASAAGSTSSLFLDAGSVTSLGFGPFYVGSSGNGYLALDNGGTLTTPFGTVIGLNSGAVGTATVSGGNSAWTITNSPLRVGSSGNGTLNVLAGGSVTAYALELGENLNSNGAISMSGLGATLNVVTTGVGVGAGIADIGGASATSPAASATITLGTGAVMNLNGTTNFRTNATVNMNGGLLNLNVVNFASGATVNWSSGQINFATAPTITSSILDILLDGTHTLGTNRTLSATAGTLTLTTPLTITGGAISAPTIDLNSNLDIGPFSNITASNTITLESGNTIELENFATLAATTSVTNNGGTLQLDGPLANVTGPVTNTAGYITGTGRFTAGLNNAAGGTIRLESSDHIIVDTVGPTNVGTIELAGGTIEYSKSLTNQAGGTISGRGVFRGSSAAPGGTGLTNQGVLSFSAGVSDIYGDVNNTGTGQIIAAGASIVTFYDDVVNNGIEIRTVAGSRTVFFGSVSGAGPFTGTGITEFEGDLKPGNSPANVSFGGNVVLGATAGADIELAGLTKGTQYDSLTVAGSVALSGTLNVTLLNNFMPSSGETFEIMKAAGGITGAFDAMNFPSLPGGLYFSLAYTPTDILLSVNGIIGDYNRNGIIDSGDYVLWRKTVTQTGPGLAADGNNNGTIDPADFTIWRTSFGNTSATGASRSTAPIPESSPLLLVAVMLTATALVARTPKHPSHRPPLAI